MTPTRKDAVAMMIIALVLLLISLIAFTPRYFSPLLAGGYVAPSHWMHVHVISSLLWLVLFLIQPLLVLQRRLNRHRLFGRVALLVAIITAGTGFAVQWDLLPLIPGDLNELGAFTTRFVAGLGIFIPAVTLAVVYRKRSAWHLRLMYVATLSLMASPFNRILVFYLGVPFDLAGPLTNMMMILMMIALPIYDRLIHGKVEAISWLALAVAALAQALTTYLIFNPIWVGLMTGE